MEVAVQTGEAESRSSEISLPLPDRPLLYAALLGSKAEAADGVKSLLAQINDDHAGLPHSLYFRLHSDRGGEFLSEELNAYCREHAIHKTTTQGYDPNANASAEQGVGTLKRRCRYLLAGSRLPTKFWGVGILAAAQLERADLGVGDYPKIPFGTRGMMVTSPAPRNAWVPRAEPCTIFGACDHIRGAQWVYQKGWIKPRADLQPEGLSQDDLVWVKLNVRSWDAPDCPMDLPDIIDFDAAAVPMILPSDRPAATRETASCEACLQTRYGRRQTRLHTLVWGECLRAPRPSRSWDGAAGDLDQPEGNMEAADPELAEHQPDIEHIPGEVDRGRSQAGPGNPRAPEPIDRVPHAALALAVAKSMAATWGTASFLGDSTAAPGDDTDREAEDDDSDYWDDDEFGVAAITRRSCFR